MLTPMRFRATALATLALLLGALATDAAGSVRWHNLR